jgi:glycosyltransferase involved in cell wall biosynthesis
MNFRQILSEPAPPEPGVPERSAIRLLVFLEADNVSGPVKNFLEFCRRVRGFEAGNGIEIFIATFRRTGDGRPVTKDGFLSAAEECGVPVFVIPERFPFDPQILDHMRALVKQLSPELIETHAVKSHFLIRLSGLDKACPWLAFHHGYTSTSLKSPWYNSLDRWSLRVPDRIVTVSRAFEQQLIERGAPGSRIMVMQNAIEPVLQQSDADRVAKRRGIRNELGLGTHERMILSAGRLSREKAHVNLVAAVAELRRIDPDFPIRLVIAGDGPERLAIVEAVRRAGLTGSVTLLGHISDLSGYYAAADVVAISSLSEGSPNVLLEAMAASVPVVATRVGGIPEIVSDGESALLVAPNDPAAMAAAAHRLLSDRKLAAVLTSSALAIVRDRHSPLSRMRSLMDLYRSLHAQARNGTSLPVPDRLPGS